MICSVPANETITATVTVTNAAGLITSKSAYAGLLKHHKGGEQNETGKHRMREMEQHIK